MIWDIHKELPLPPGFRWYGSRIWAPSAVRKETDWDFFGPLSAMEKTVAYLVARGCTVREQHYTEEDYKGAVRLGGPKGFSVSTFFTPWSNDTVVQCVFVRDDLLPAWQTAAAMLDTATHFWPGTWDRKDTRCRVFETIISQVSGETEAAPDDDLPFLCTGKKMPRRRRE